jgi:PAS domain S-box-containing protein
MTFNDRINDNKFKVLVVDDEKSIRFLLAQMLESEGYLVLEAEDGESAIKIFNKEKPDMILIDAMMPILDGMSTCRRLRQSEAGKSVPVLMLTGLDDDSVVDMAFEAGVSDFITKPFQFSVLRQRVKRILRLKTAESLLEERLSNERSITEAVEDGIIITDMKNHIISFNSSAEFIFNYKSHEILGANISAIIPELADEIIKLDYNDNGEYKNIKIKKETAGIKNGGEKFPARVTLNGLDSGNKLISVHDLTERKQTQSAIKTADLVFNNIKEAICVLDSACAIQFANPAFRTLSDCAEAQLTDCPLKSIIAGAKSLTAFDNAINNILPGEQKQIEIMISTKNNAECPVLMIINRIAPEEFSKQSTYVIIFHDFTEQLKLRDKQEALQKQAVNIQKMTLLSTISAGVIHEINQPLNSIKILADSLIFLNKKGRTIEMAKVFENLQKISDQIIRIDEIIKQMRAFAGYKQGQAATKCDLNAAIEKTHAMLKHQLSLKGIKLSKNLSPDLEEIPGNINIIEEVAVNLMINAIQAFEKVKGKEKEIICETKVDKNKVVFEVSDNATGIEDELKERIFDPFYSTKTLDGGMGLGLAIVSSILTGYNAKIEVNNNSRGGATFRVELPRAPSSVKTEN